jgi:hypothetical protein
MKMRFLNLNTTDYNGLYEFFKYELNKHDIKSNSSIEKDIKSYSHFATKHPSDMTKEEQIIYLRLDTNINFEKNKLCQVLGSESKVDELLKKRFKK